MHRLTRLRDRILALKKHTKAKLPRDLPDHLYRDIGLTQPQVDWLRHEWPSRSTDALRR